MHESDFNRATMIKKGMYVYKLFSLRRQNSEFSQKACPAFKLYHFTDNCIKQMGLPYARGGPSVFDYHDNMLNLVFYNITI